jgi:hypothetical protein
MTFVMDQNGNRATIERWGSKKKALESLQTLLNCENCTDCERCFSCRDCVNCSHCRRVLRGSNRDDGWYSSVAR